MTKFYGVSTTFTEFIKKTLPLSTAQRGLWAAEKIGPPNALYSIAEYMEINGFVDVEHFLASLRQVSVEAATLRVQIIELDGQPRQVIRGCYEGDFPYHDFSQFKSPRETASEWMQQALKQPFDLAQDPLWQSALIKISDSCYYWFHRCHHIILDGFGGSLISRRLAEIYSSRVQGSELTASPFAPLENIIEDEKTYRASKRFARDKQFWQQQLANLPEAASLAKNKAPSSAGVLRHSFKIPAANAKRFRSLAQANACTMPQVLVALTAAYFYRATGGLEDLVFGMPVSARTGRLMRSVPGMMANAVPIRLSINPQTNFSTLIQQVAKTMMRALRHQQYRYEDMRRDLNLTSEGKQISWIGVNVEPFDYCINFAGCKASPHNLCNGAIEDLTIFIYDRCDNQGLHVDIDANGALYSKGELAEYAERLMRLFEHLLVDPLREISQVNILNPAQRRKILIDWNDTAKPNSAATVIDLFEMQVNKNAHAPALIACDAHLSYAELHRRVMLCASYLADAGVGAGSLVALAQPRRSEMLVAMLAVLKTGAAYLPLDSTYPKERLQAILIDAEPDVLLGHSASRIEFDGACPCIEMYIDFFPSDAPTTMVSGFAAKNNLPNGESRAYVIYTSGSTGQPKGVVITHRSLSNFLLAMSDELNIQRSDCMLAVTTVVFDIAALELFLPLTVGASLVLAERETVADPDALVKMTEVHPVTLMQATPSMWQSLVPRYSDKLLGVKPLVGGEALSSKLARDLAVLGHPVINLYGPTEATIWATIMVLKTERDFAAPPIGRPLRNTQVYVLDQVMQPVPVGVPGDLYIAGECLSKGYLNREDLTAQQFIAHPFDKNRRLYRTGDKARWREDGVIEYLGREDNQAKIRGFRVEMGELETQLLANEGVKQAVASCVKGASGNNTLIAYVVPQQEGGIDEAALMQSLAAQLPEYMLPSRLIALPKLPLTANGKIDRRALPAPVWQSENQLFEPPKTSMEKLLVGIWQEVLGIERISVNDDFFRLGGDSITAAQMLVELRSSIATELPLSLIFKATTIRKLANGLEQNCDQGLLRSLLSIRVGSATPLFCIHPIIGLSWAYSALLQYIPSETPLYGLQITGLEQPRQKPPNSIEEMAEEYLKEILKVQPHGPYQLVGWSMGGLVAHALTERLEKMGEEVKILAMLDSYPFCGKKEGGEQDWVDAGLRFLGYHFEEEVEKPNSMQALAQFLCDAYQVNSMPVVQAIQKIHPNIVNELSETVEHNLNLASQFRPGNVRAETLLFVAEHSRSSGVSNFLNQSSLAWRPHLQNLTEVYGLPCDHQSMLEPRQAAIVGREISRKLVDHGSFQSLSPTSKSVSSNYL